LRGDALKLHSKTSAGGDIWAASLAVNERKIERNRLRLM
jgi:hypothetical protein